LSALFKDGETPQREAYQIHCEAVSRFNCSLDTSELKKNMFAGNISNAYLKENTLWVYFTDGLLEIHAKNFVSAKANFRVKGASHGCWTLCDKR